MKRDAILLIVGELCAKRRFDCMLRAADAQQLALAPAITAKPFDAK